MFLSVRIASEGSLPLLFFKKNWSIASVLDAASWRSNSVFASFYLRDLQFEYKSIRSLGPLVAAGEQIG